jgi:glucose-1-phosphatase
MKAPYAMDKQIVTSENKTVFFDLGNVLIFFSLDKMFQQLSDCTNIPQNVLRLALTKNLLFQEIESGQITIDQFYRILQSQTSHPFSFNEMLIAMSDIFTPNLDLWKVVEKLKAQGTRLVLISNTNECHFNFAYSHFPILKLFDRFILSYEVKACKPSPKIFLQALQEARGAAFYTDDIPAYIQAARSVGLDGEIFTTVPVLVQHLQDRKMLI